MGEAVPGVMVQSEIQSGLLVADISSYCRCNVRRTRFVLSFFTILHAVAVRVICQVFIVP